MKIINKIYKFLYIIFYRKLLNGLLYGVAATTEHIPILISIKNIKTIIDIGANKGQFALASRFVFPKARIFSFEPLQFPVQKFNDLFKKDRNIIMHNHAIGPEKRLIPMHISKREDSSSLFPIGSRQSAIFPGTEESHTEEVEVAPLHHFIEKDDLISPVFVKIDVQGYEIEVLKGCNNLIENIDYIYVECSFIELYDGQPLADDVINSLSNHSFRLKGIYNVHYDKNGIAVQADFLFIK